MQQEIACSLRDNIGEALARSVARNPETTAVTFEGRSWTYAELDAATNAPRTPSWVWASVRATGSPPTGATPTHTWCYGSRARGPA